MSPITYEGLRPAEEVPEPTVFLTGRNLASWWDKHSPKSQEAEDNPEESGGEQEEEQTLDE